MVQFTIKCGHLCFSLFLVIALTSGNHSRPDTRWGQRDREASPMWTHNGNVDLGERKYEWGYNEWKGSDM